MGPIPMGRASACPWPGHVRAAALAATAALSLAAAPASAQAPAQAADTCPNADVRAQQAGGTLLPDCRAYELVSPNDTGHQILLRRTVSAAGDQVTWGTYGPFPGSAVGVPGELRSVRTADGWRTDFELTPFVSVRPSTINDKQEPVLVDPETPGRRIFVSTFPFFEGDKAGARANTPLVSNDLMARDPEAPLAWLTAPTSGVTGVTENVLHTVLAATPDLSRTLVQSNRGMTAQVPGNGTYHLYLTQRGGPTRLVTVAPGAPGSTTPLTGYRQSGSVIVTLASEDLDTIVFQQTGTDRIYARLHATDPARAQTIEVTAGPNGGACGPSAKTLALARDGAKVAFRCNQPADGTTGPTRSYFYVRDLRIADVDAPGAFTEVPEFPEAVHFTTDGLERAFDISAKLVRTGGTTRTLLSGTGLPNMNAVRMSRDGRFVSAVTGEVPGVDLGGTQQVMLVDTDETDPDAATTCVSCPADGSVPTASSTTQEHVNGRSPLARFGLSSGVMGQEGSYVVFQTAQALVPRDTNGQVDVYLWEDGEHHLLSSGTSPKPTELVEASQDGSTVFLLTHDALVPQDDDNGQQDLYAVRTRGGFLAPAPPAPECTTDCQPVPAPPAPVVPAPTELLRGGGGNVVQERTPTVRLTLSGTRTLTGTQGTVSAKVSGAGLLTVSGSGVRSESRAARRSGTYRLTVRLSDARKRTLRRTGKATVAVTVRYQPLAGATKTQRRTLTFRVAKAKTTSKKGAR